MHTGSQEVITFPAEAKAIVDVTQPPYNLDRTGNTDCTRGLIQAFNDVVELGRKELIRTEQYFAQNPFSGESLQVIRQKGGIMHPQHLPPTRILYFPNGTYLVSDTIRYTVRDLQNSFGSEKNRLIHFRGESERKSVLKLKDGCAGFEAGAERPVVDIMGGISSNNSMHNFFENLTIDVGSGNPGAVGLVFFANNCGAVRNVTIRSSDPERRGQAGFVIRNRNSSCVLVKHLTVVGFECGISIRHNRLNTVLEHIHVREQRICGVHVDRHNVSLRRLTSEIAVPALKITGRESVVDFVDSDLRGRDTGCPAIDLRDGYLFARGIRAPGYACALQYQGGTEISDTSIEEYGSCSPVVLFSEERRRSLNLEVEETPEIPWENNHANWACVNDFGAVGDGTTDDTEAIRAAAASGKPVVYFQPGAYVVDGTVELPATLQRLNFMHCDLVAGPNLRHMHGKGAFRIAEEAETPLLIEDLHAHEEWRGGHYLVDHASTRTVVLSDLTCLLGAMYTNSTPGGKVFIENVFSQNKGCREHGCFQFHGQHVWARQINPEKANPQIRNDGSSLWILGFKTEHPGALLGTAFLTENGGRTEVLGGTINQSVGDGAPPSIVNLDSDVAVVSSTTDWRELTRPVRHTVVEERRDNVTHRISWGEFPLRGDGELIAIPLYVGRARRPYS